MKCAVCLTLLAIPQNEAVTVANGNAVCIEHLAPALIQSSLTELVASVKHQDQRSKRFLAYLRGESPTW